MTASHAEKPVTTTFASNGCRQLPQGDGEPVGDYSYEEFSAKVADFHGSPAPGVLIGGYMVQLARQGLAEGTLFEAVCETRACLPDAIQLLTPCTLGNNRVKVVHVGRFALTLYDKTTGRGFRAFLDPKKLKVWPEIYSWFLKLKPKAEQDSEELLREIGWAGASILTVEPVVVKGEFFAKKKLGAVQLCPECGEAYPSSEGERCGGCQGELPYAGVPVQATPLHGDRQPARI